MERELSLLKQFFKVFYNVIVIFVGLTVAFFIMSYFSRLHVAEEDVYGFHDEVLKIMEADIKVQPVAITLKKDFYKKYNSANLKFIDSVIVIMSNGQGFFTGSPEKTYQYKGTESGKNLILGNVILRDQLMTHQRMGNGYEVVLVTSKDMIRDLTFSKWLEEHRLQFSVNILLPLLIMVLVMLIEDKLIKELEQRAGQFFSRLREQEAEKDAIYSGLFYDNKSIMLLIEPLTGRIVSANEAAEQYYGYQFQEEAIHISQINTMPAEIIFEIMQEAIRQNKSYFNFQHRLKNGMIRDVEVYSGPVQIKGQELLCSVIHDVTDKIRAEQSLMNERLSIENKLKLKMDILGTISHEIKTPMAGIVHNLEDLSQKITEPHLLRELQFLKINMDNLNRLVFDLLDYSRIDAGNFKLYSTQFNLEEVLESSIQLFKPLAQAKKLKLTLELSMLKRRHFVGDAFRIGQIINNLLSNSIKYTNEGKVEVRVFSEAMDQQSLVTIEVTDTGIGMKPEVVNMIFSKYFTTDTTGQMAGTGLGLAICRMIVEAMNGTLEVESTEKIGTKMTLILELDNDLGADLNLIQSTGTVFSTKPVEKHPISVLLVDDDPMNLLFLERLLAASKLYEVKTQCVYSAEEALNHLAHKVYDVIISDYQLPGLLGTALFETLNQQYQTGDESTLILMSADMVADISPAHSFLLKPIGLKQLEFAFSRRFEGQLLHQAENQEQKSRVETPSAQTPFKVDADPAPQVSMEILEVGAVLNENRFIDWSSWEYLNENLMPEEAIQILSIFIKSHEEKRLQFPKVVEGKYLEKIERLLHVIKGGVGYFRCEAFYHLTVNLENQVFKARSSEGPVKLEGYEFFLEAYTDFIEDVKRIKRLFESS